jgi:hypothetical protein
MKKRAMIGELARRAGVGRQAIANQVKRLGLRPREEERLYPSPFKHGPRFLRRTVLTLGENDAAAIEAERSIGKVPDGLVSEEMLLKRFPLPIKRETPQRPSARQITNMRRRLREARKAGVLRFARLLTVERGKKQHRPYYTETDYHTFRDGLPKDATRIVTDGVEYLAQRQCAIELGISMKYVPRFLRHWLSAEDGKNLTSISERLPGSSRPHRYWPSALVRRAAANRDAAEAEGSPFTIQINGRPHVTRKEVARLCKVSPVTVFGWIEDDCPALQRKMNSVPVPQSRRCRNGRPPEGFVPFEEAQNAAEFMRFVRKAGWKRGRLPARIVAEWKQKLEAAAKAAEQNGRATTTTVPTTEQGKKRRRGKQPLAPEIREQDARLLANYKASHVGEKEFARLQHMSVAELRKRLIRHRMYIARQLKTV